MKKIIGLLVIIIGGLFTAWQGYMYLHGAHVFNLEAFAAVKIIFGFFVILVGYIVYSVGKQGTEA